MPTLLVIDDDPEGTEQVADWFAALDYRILRAHSGREGLQVARDTLPDVILLDICMPGMDGHEVLLMLKRNSDTAGIPVVIRSIKGDDPDGLQELTLRGLREGADYVTALKWSMPALEEVVKRALVQPEQLPIIRVGAHELKLGDGCREVWLDGKRRQLTNLEAGVLSFLNQNRGEPQQVQALEQHVWKDAETVKGDNRVRRVIDRLRNKVEPDPSIPVFIVTDTGHGYKLVTGDPAP